MTVTTIRTWTDADLAKPTATLADLAIEGAVTIATGAPVRDADTSSQALVGQVDRPKKRKQAKGDRPRPAKTQAPPPAPRQPKRINSHPRTRR